MASGLDLGSRLGQREHAVFGLALLLLVALAVWWSRTLSGLITSEHELRLVALREGAYEEMLRLQDLTVGAESGEYVVVGVDGAHRACAPMVGQLLSLCPKAEVLAETDARFARRRAMVQGESGLLLVLLLLCVLMLYRLVVAERRFRGEIEFFLGVVTHEMKTPLAALKALLQTLARGRVPADQLGELVSLGLDQLRREEQLVSNLLRLQRLRVAGSQLERVPVPLRPLLEQQARERVAQVPEGGDLVVQLGGELAAVGDAEAIRSVLDNLLDNALKFGGQNIALSAERAGSEVVLRCTDDGRGFSEGDLDTLFAAFRRVGGENGTGPSGTGLGLFLSRQLAERMGGRLDAVSAGPGRGATFTLRLRAAEVA